MLTIRTIRKENLLAQIARCGSQRAFAQKAGLASAHVSQMVTERRNMGDEVARRIEKNLNLASGHMDQQHFHTGYYTQPPFGEHNRIAESDNEIRHFLSKGDQMQRMSANTQRAVLRIERAAVEGRLSDADWEILERLVERFESGA